VDQHLGCGNVGGNGDRVHVTQAQQHHIIRLTGLGADRIAEKEQHVDLTAADHGSDLLGTAAPARIQAAHRQPGGIVDDLAGHTGGNQFVLRQNAQIGCAELRHQLLAGIVGNYCDSHS